MPTVSRLLNKSLTAGGTRSLITGHRDLILGQLYPVRTLFNFNIFSTHAKVLLDFSQQLFRNCISVRASRTLQEFWVTAYVYLQSAGFSNHSHTMTPKSHKKTLFPPHRLPLTALNAWTKRGVLECSTAVHIVTTLIEQSPPHSVRSQTAMQTARTKLITSRKHQWHTRAPFYISTNSASSWHFQRQDRCGIGSSQPQPC